MQSVIFQQYGVCDGKSFDLSEILSDLFGMLRCIFDH